MSEGPEGPNDALRRLRGVSEYICSVVSAKPGSGISHAEGCNMTPKTFDSLANQEIQLASKLDSMVLLKPFLFVMLVGEV